MNKLERGVLEIRNGRYVDNGMPADCGGGDGFYWYEVATDEKLISRLYGPFPTSIEAAEAAAATQLSLRQVEAVLNNLARKGVIKSAVVNGEKRWWVPKGS
jgi:hypothetical protein